MYTDTDICACIHIYIYMYIYIYICVYEIYHGSNLGVGNHLLFTPSFSGCRTFEGAACDGLHGHEARLLGMVGPCKPWSKLLMRGLHGSFQPKILGLLLLQPPRKWTSGLCRDNVRQ